MINLYIDNCGVWNIYHFLFFMVAHLRHIKDTPDNIALDLSDGYFSTHHNFPREILTIMYPTANIVQANSCPPGFVEATKDSFPAETHRGDPLVYEEVYDYLRKIFLPLLETYKPQNTYSKYIYLTRWGGEADKRLVLNETELLERSVFKKFQVVYLSKMTFMEQVYVFNNASVIIGPHGAGFTNIMFCKQPCQIIELGTPYMSRLMHFEKIATTIGLTSYSKFSTVKPLNLESYTSYEDNFLVDIDALVLQVCNS